MSWTSATSIRPRAAHPSRMPILSKHRESTDLFRSYPEASDPVGKDSPRFVHLFTCRSTPLSAFYSTFAHRLRADRGDARVHSRGRKRALFCTILVQCKSFRCNTSEPPPMCCKQRTCAISKSRRCNTCKKHRGPGGVLIFALIPNPLRSSLVTHHLPSPRSRPFRRKLNHAVS